MPKEIDVAFQITKIVEDIRKCITQHQAYPIVTLKPSNNDSKIAEVESYIRIDENNVLQCGKHTLMSVDGITTAMLADDYWRLPIKSLKNVLEEQFGYEPQSIGLLHGNFFGRNMTHFSRQEQIVNFKPMNKPKE